MVFLLDDAVIAGAVSLICGIIIKMIHSKVKKSKCRAQLGGIGLNIEMNVNEETKEEEKTNETI